MFWAFSHFLWRVISSEAGNTSTGGAGGGEIDGQGGVSTPAWVWVDMGMAWVLAPAAGGSLQLSLWGSIVPSWLCVTGALAFGLRAEEVRMEGNKTKRYAQLISYESFGSGGRENVLKYSLGRAVV